MVLKKEKNAKKEKRESKGLHVYIKSEMIGLTIYVGYSEQVEGLHVQDEGAGHLV
jgi:hypothetical protein